MKKYCYYATYEGKFFIDQADAISNAIKNISKEDAMELFFDECNKEQLFDFIFKWGCPERDLIDMENDLAELIGDEYVEMYSLEEIEEQIEYEIQCLEKEEGIFSKEFHENRIADLQEIREQLIK